MHKYLFILFCLYSYHSYGQIEWFYPTNTSDFDKYKLIKEEKSVDGIKSIKIYSSKKLNDKNPDLFSSKKYNSQGKIEFSKEYDIIYYPVKPGYIYKETFYNYNGDKLISKNIFIYACKNNKSKYYNIYNDDFKIYLTIFSVDSLVYSYKNNGLVDYIINYDKNMYNQVFPKDTTYYLYSDNGRVYSSKYKNDSISFEKLDSNGCLIGYTDEDTSYTLHTFICDENCNIIDYKEKIVWDTDKKLLLVEHIINQYDNNRIIESKHYEAESNIIFKLNLLLKEWKKYSYNDLNNIDKIYYYNKNEKLIEVKEYNYEYY